MESDKDLELENQYPNENDSEVTENSFKEHLIKRSEVDDDQDDGSHQLDLEEKPQDEASSKPVPLWAWLLLSLALFFVSSAAAVLKYLQDVKPILRASWRLQILVILLAPGMAYQWHKAPSNLRIRFFTYETWKYIILSSLSLAVHFGTWILSLDLTSLSHSLLFVTCTPLLIVAAKGMFSNKWFNWMKRPTFVEIAGALIGFAGMTITLLDFKSDKEVTLVGDLLALLGAFTFWGHLAAGMKLRDWMPLFIYTFPVTFLANIFLIIGSLILEGTTFTGLHNSSVVGWLQYPSILWILYLGIGPGLFGHNAINSVIKYMDPVVVTIFLLMEPVIGSIIGWIFGVGTIPGKFTWIGGTIIMISLMWITMSEAKSVQRTNMRIEIFLRESVKTLRDKIKSFV